MTDEEFLATNPSLEQIKARIVEQAKTALTRRPDMVAKLAKNLKANRRK